MDQGLVRLRALNGRKYKILLALLDVFFLLSSFALALFFRFGTDPLLEMIHLNTGISLCITLFSLYVLGGYDLSTQHRLRTLLARFLLGLLISFLLLLVISYLFALGREGLWGRGVLIGSLALYFSFGVLSRIFFWKLLNRQLKRNRYLVLISAHFYDDFVKDVQRTALVGSFDYLLDLKSEKSEAANVIGLWDDYTNTLASNYESAILAPSGEFPAEVVNRLLKGRVLGQNILDLMDFYESMFAKVPLFYLRDWLLISTPGFYLNQSPVRYRMKRLFDVIFSGILLLVTSPLLLIAGVLVKVTSSGPILFKQARVGRGGENFKILKLRTMRNDAEKMGAQWAQENDPRITSLGRFLRATRIDELPQLLNVLQGDMSLIGPRPERPEFTSLLEQELPFYALRHSILPGITGWAQVLFPYGASVEDAKDKLQYELYYIRNYSLWMDLKIALQTIQVVIFGRGR